MSITYPEQVLCVELAVEIAKLAVRSNWNDEERAHHLLQQTYHVPESDLKSPDLVRQYAVNGFAEGRVMHDQQDQYPSALFWQTAAQWIWLVYGLEQIGVRREPFLPHADCAAIIGKLVDGGYARRLGAQILWTDAFSGPMRWTGLWNDDNLSHAELDEIDDETQAREAFADVPEDVRAMVRRGDMNSVAVALSHRWQDGVWQPPGPADRWWKIPSAADRSRILFQLIAEDEGMQSEPWFKPLHPSRD
jgi:hypothetical protein